MLRTTVIGYEFYDYEISYDRVMGKVPHQMTKKPMDMAKAKICPVPDSIRFIVCIRDPRAIITSKHWQVDEFSVSCDWSIHSVVHGKIRKMEGLRAMDRYIREVTNPVYLFYENLIRHPNEEQERLGDLFDLKYKGEFTDFYRHETPEQLTVQLNGLRPLDFSRLDSWKQYPERIIKQFTDCPYLHEMLYKYGYERNRDWFKQLQQKHALQPPTEGEK